MWSRLYCVVVPTDKNLRKEDLSSEKQKAKKFLIEFTELSEGVMTLAKNYLKENKLNNESPLPETTKISEINNYVDDEILQLINKFNNEETNFEDWKKLADLTAASLTMYSRQRGGTVQKLKINAYKTVVNNQAERQRPKELAP